MSEHFPVVSQEAIQQEIPEHELMLRFGISAAEGAQQVEFGGHSGTLAQMLTDEACPVGAMVEQAHTEGGVDAVRQKLDGINTLFGSSITTEITPKSQEEYDVAIEAKANDVKKN
jgi:hypothetical protein